MRTLKKHKNAAPFLVPVDPVALGIPHYPEIVKRPMDFATIERKLFATGLDEGTGTKPYRNADEWIADVHQVFQNSYLFNGDIHPISKMAQTVEATFNKLLKKMPSADDTGPLAANSPDDDGSQAPTPALRNNASLPPDSSSASADHLAQQQLRYCGKILDHLWKPEFANFAWFFYNPVSEKDIPGYHKVIENPMSMAVMREKLNSGKYPDPQAFRADFDQIIWNCNKFNPVGSVAQACAKQLKDIFEKKWKTMPKGSKGTTNTSAKSLKISRPSLEPRKSIDRFSREGSATQRESVVASSPVEAASVSSSTPATPAVPTSSKPLPSLLPSVLLPPSPKPRPPPLAIPAPPRPALPVPPRPALPVPPRPALPAPPQPSSAQKRKSSAVELEEARERTERHLTPQEQHRLSRAIHKLSGPQLERAVEMIQSGVGDTPLCENQAGDMEFEVSRMPAMLVRTLYVTFVGPLDGPTSNKRPRRVTASNGATYTSDQSDG
ncbi:hypothetical protein FRC04_005892 [Tulasnella sp. 424]|nr:hypothetical protein FRC04_005892 [Tulasnella sp. 424]KAG8976037.1 hypothetical protein FRC05_004668 [Tulasnella sp. 425]